MHLSPIEWITVIALGILTFNPAARDFFAEDSPMNKVLPRVRKWRIWSYVPLLAFAVVLGGSLYAHKGEVDGLNPPWPDAIVCEQPEHGNVTESRLVFYYKGHGSSRGGLGPVAMYFLVGAFNDPTGYFPHELWFREKLGDLVTRSHINSLAVEEPIETRYKNAFLTEINCLGKKYKGSGSPQTIQDIKSAGNSYVFAKMAR
jgi:hypothetical protein